ncbi:MAG: glycogen/starch/alpha-glucan phosphorylase [Leptospiraceae bacterium]|nr:glycogen/starch/alpha-glucan phosphorylase [Leptospiraceae bacterium]
MQDAEKLAKQQKLWNLMDQDMRIDLDSLTRAFAHHLEYNVCKYRESIKGGDIYQALAFTVRDFLIDRFNETQREIREQKARRVYYLSMEFLMGKLLETNLVNLGVKAIVEQSLAQIGYDLQEIVKYEPDAGLGNGGLGRLAACFLDSVSAMNLPVSGASIRYEFGIFNQNIINGHQKESPDNWLTHGNPWEIRRDDIMYPVHFYGQAEQFVDARGHVRHRWIPGETIMAQAYDLLVPGYDTRMVNNLRLWASRASDEFNFEYFNHGDYIRAVEDKQRSESISKVLYPNENIQQGKELRLKQEYLLVSATVQDALATFIAEEGENFDRLSERVFMQLNDTHPALAVSELMRLLVDRYSINWEAAWELTTRVFAYTNHTVLPEALEKWDLGMFENLLPRHIQIIYEINSRFLNEMRERGANPDELQRLSIIEEGAPRRVRMANLAFVGSSAVNGVAALHTEIIKNNTFAHFHKFFPERIQNKTNGITHRRWIVSSNPELSALISEAIGIEWIKDLAKLRDLDALAHDSAFQEKWRQIKRLNKEKLGHILQFECGINPDPDSLFDIQVKRIHEYKRQHLNILRVIADYQAMKANPDREYTPRTVIFAGKAAPGYLRAKNIIKLIHSVADIINHDPEVSDRLKVAFLPNYRVSLAERIFPAAELSEQISTAGMEASGTGNMKFMLNGALTVGTLDGANIEIKEEVGDENIYIFGKTVEELDLIRAGYDPLRICNQTPPIKQVMDALYGNYFNLNEPGLFHELHQTLLFGGDYYFLMADFMDYVAIQEQIGTDYRNKADWTAKSIYNTARSGKFSSDRTIGQYAAEIWHTRPIHLSPPRISAHHKA